MKNYIFLLLLLGGIYYNAVIFNSQSLLFGLYFFIFLMICLFICSVVTAWNIRVDMVMINLVVADAEEVGIRCNVTNSSFLPSGKIKVVVQTESFLERKKKKTAFYVTVPGKGVQSEIGKVSFDAVLSPKMPGKITIQVQKVFVYDFLGILPVPVRKKRYRVKDSVVVLPPKYTASLRQEEEGKRTKHLWDGKKRYVTTEGEMDIFQLRSYQPGDRLRNIHWKMTAKTDEITIFDREEPTGAYVILFFDSRLLPVMKKRGKRYLKKKERTLCKQYMTLCYNAGCNLLDNEIAFYASWFDEEQHDMVRYLVKCSEDWEKVMFKWNCLDQMQEGELETAYFQKYGSGEVVEIFTVTAELSLIDKDGCVLTLAQLQDMSDSYMMQSENK